MDPLELFPRAVEHVLPLPDADVRLHPGFLPEAEADELLARCLDELPWRQDAIHIHGRRVLQPRLTCWLGDPGHSYTYSGLDHVPEPWPDWLQPVLADIQDRVGRPLNGALANLYRDGQDAMGWHADDESELGAHPVIASLSLGATRDFRLKHRTRTDVAPLTLPLHHGSLLVMAGSTQHHWLHALPRRARVSTPRVNLTFRRVETEASRARRRQ